MELEDILAWIDTRLVAKGWSDKEASDKAGHPYCIQNMRKTLRNGHGSRPKAETLQDLARALGEPPPALSAPATPSALRVDVEAALEARLAAAKAEVERLENALQLVREVRHAG